MSVSRKNYPQNILMLSTLVKTFASSRLFVALRGFRLARPGILLGFTGRAGSTITRDEIRTGHDGIHGDGLEHIMWRRL